MIKVFTVVFDIPDGAEAPTEDKVLDALIDGGTGAPEGTVYTVTEAFMPTKNYIGAKKEPERWRTVIGDGWDEVPER
jgi:hypothetical protein